MTKDNQPEQPELPEKPEHQSEIPLEVEPVKKPRRGTPFRTLDKDRYDGILKAYANGDTIVEIETKFETSRGQIYRMLKDNNITRSRPSNKWEGKKHSDGTKAKMSQSAAKLWETRKSTLTTNKDEVNE